MSRLAAKDNTIQIRIPKALKDRAESILDELYMTRSQAIALFYKKIIDHNGIPFDLSLDYDPFPLSNIERNELRQGRKEIESGNYTSVDSEPELTKLLDSLK